MARGKGWVGSLAHPPAREDYADICYRSVDVLMTDGKDCFVGYLADHADDGDYVWYIKGQDGYTFEPTHWMRLPEMP